MPAFLTRAILLFLHLALASAQPALASPTNTIKVGIYDFPPVATVDYQNRARGLLGDLLQELQSVHDNLNFQIVYTSPKRRHLDFASGLFNVMFFESPDWSWDPDSLQVSAPVLKDQDVYVALNKDNRDQSFFDDISKRRIVAIAGYHYGFADFETNAETLSQNFDIEFSSSHDRNLDLIEADRPSLAEVAVISRSFLSNHFARFPDQRDRFLISDKVDQTYELYIIARKDGPIEMAWIERLLRPLIESGRYQELVRQHELQLPEGMIGAP